MASFAQAAAKKAAGIDPNAPISFTNTATPAAPLPGSQEFTNSAAPQPIAQPYPSGTGGSFGYGSDLPAPTTSTAKTGGSSGLDPIAFIRQYQSANAASPQAVQDLFAQLQAQYGINRYDYGVQSWGGGPSGNEIDYNGKRKIYSEGGNSWYDPDGLSNDGGGSSAGAGGGGATPMTMSPTTGYGVPASMPQTASPYDAALQAAIMGLLNTPQTVDAESLRHTPEFQAEQLGGQRAEERQRAQLAERASAEGWSDSGGMDTQLQGIRADRGNSEADFLGNLATSKMQDNKERLLAGIQAATQSGQFQQAEALQLELANLDAAIRRETLAQQGSQFNDSLGFNYTSLQEQANEASTRALLGL